MKNEDTDISEYNNVALCSGNGCKALPSLSRSMRTLTWMNGRNKMQEKASTDSKGGTVEATIFELSSSMSET